MGKDRSHDFAGGKAELQLRLGPSYLVMGLIRAMGSMGNPHLLLSVFVGSLPMEGRSQSFAAQEQSDYLLSQLHFEFISEKEARD